MRSSWKNRRRLFAKPHPGSRVPASVKSAKAACARSLRTLYKRKSRLSPCAETFERWKQMLPGADVGAARRAGPAKLMQLRSNLENLEEQLRDGRAYLLGD